MRTDDSQQKHPAKQTRHDHQTGPYTRRASSAPHAWTNKTMHHPATRIGEIKHGKS